MDWIMHPTGTSAGGHPSFSSCLFLFYWCTIPASLNLWRMFVLSLVYTYCNVAKRAHRCSVPYTSYSGLHSERMNYCILLNSIVMYIVRNIIEYASCTSVNKCAAIFLHLFSYCLSANLTTSSSLLDIENSVFAMLALDGCSFKLVLYLSRKSRQNSGGVVRL